MQGHLDGRLWERLARGVIAAALLASCGGGSSNTAPPPQQVEPITDAGLAHMAAEALARLIDPDEALRSYQGAVEQVLDETPDLAIAGDLLALSPLRNLDASTADAFAVLHETVDGRVYSASFGALSRASLAQVPLCEENVDEARTIVYFVNGIRTSIFDALASLHVLRRRTGDVFDPPAEFRLFYNASGFRTPEAECNYYGLTMADTRVTGSMRARVEAAARSRCARTGDLADIGEAIAQWLDRDDDPPEAFLVSKLRDLVIADVISGKKVVLVAHSQGNLYVEAALRSLIPETAPDGGSPPAGSVGAVAVASPIEYGADVASLIPVEYVQLFGDVIHAVPGAPSSTVENERSRKVRGALEAAGQSELLILGLGLGGWATAAITIATYAPVFLEAVDTHAFVESYLVLPESSAQLAAAARLVNESIANDRGALGQGFFQITLTWDTPGDIDLHVFEPTGSHVYFSQKAGDVGELDRDDIPGTGPENYFVCSPGRMVEGTYFVKVNNYGGQAGAQVTMRVRAGTQFRKYSLVVDAANRGSNLIDVVSVTYGVDGSFTFSN